MRRLLWFVVALGFGFSPPTENSEDAKRFVGTWRLVAIESTPSDPTRGAQPVGLIYYDATGSMAVQIMPDRERPKWKQGESPTPAQAKETIAGYTAYFGTYTVDEKAHTVSHHRKGSLTAGGVGVDLVRRYEFAPGDRLILTPVDTPTTHLTWERVRQFLGLRRRNSSNQLRTTFTVGRASPRGGRRPPSSNCPSVRVAGRRPTNCRASSLPTGDPSSAGREP